MTTVEESNIINEDLKTERRISVKKLISILLAAVLVLSLLAACSDKPVSEDPKDTTPQQKPEPEVTVAAKVIFDADDVKITVTGMKIGWLGPEFTVDIVNGSENNINFSVSEFIVNGITVGGFGYVEAPAGKEVSDIFYLYSSDLAASGIENLSTIRCMDGSIIDSDSYERLKDFTFDLTTSVGAGHKQEINQEGNVILESENVKVISQTFTHESYGQAVRLLVLNDTGKTVIVEATDVTVNGKEVSAWMYDRVYADTVRYCELDLFATDLNGKDIDKIEKVSFRLSIIDADGYDAILETDKITIDVNKSETAP